MVASRISTYATSQASISRMLETRLEVFRKQEQIASGKITQEYSGIASETRRLVSLETQFARSEKFQSNITIVQQRVELMNNSVTQISDAARDLRSLLSSSAAADKDNFEIALGVPTQAANARDFIVDLLNERDGTRYLFAGGRTDQRPVDLNNGTYTAPTPPPFPAAANTDYYSGGSQVASVRADENFTVSYGINADNPAFEKVIRAFDTIANLTLSDPPTAAEQQVATDARDLLNTAIEELQALENNLAVDALSLAKAQEQHDVFQQRAEATIADIENVDTAQAVAELNAAQLQLEASYTTLSRIQNLSLLKFL